MQRVLLVDDDVNFRRSLTIQLELEGYDVICRENGSDALNMLHRSGSSELPEVIISDVRMPGMDGGTFLTAVSGQWPEMPLLVISAFDPPETLAGVPYLRKPFKIHQMIDAIDGLLTQA